MVVLTEAETFLTLFTPTSYMDFNLSSYLIEGNEILNHMAIAYWYMVQGCYIVCFLLMLDLPVKAARDGRHRSQVC